MNETTKTAIFVAVAAVVAVIAWLSRPTYDVMTADEMVGQGLFKEFTDPLAATSLEVIRFDEETATVEPFKVAQINNQWSIPSHSNYPADAEKQLAEAAASVMGLEVLDVVSDSAGDHELYGVLDPDPKTLEPGATGVGTRVAMRDKADDVLLDIVVGKKVPDQDELRFVRRPGQDPVYVVKLSTSKLSTKFEDWIEEDLLKLNSWDVKEVLIDDYSIDEVQQVQIRRARMNLQYNDTGDDRWEMLEDVAFEDGKPAALEMAEDEELDTSKLDDMRNALDDLKIIDVQRKPQGLSENLNQATPDISADGETRQSLSSKGFYIAQVGQDRYGLFSDEGETQVLMKNGVQYVLRFGRIAEGAGSGQAGEEDAAEESGEEKTGQDDASDVSDEEELGRYLFVMAQFNPDAVDKPELEPLPPEEPKPEGEEKSGEGDSSADPETKGQDDKTQPADAAEGGGQNGEEEEPAAEPESGGETEDSGGQSGQDEPAAEPEGEEKESAEQDEPAAEPEGEEKESAEQDEPAAEPEGEEKESAEQDEPAAGPEGKEEESAEQDAEAKDEAEDEEGKDEEGKDEEGKDEAAKEAERKRIEEENQRKQDEYDEKIEEGTKKVEELNARFADWYYVISDDVYKKIHLGRDDIVKKKEPEEEEDTEGEGMDQDPGAGDQPDVQPDDGAPAPMDAETPSDAADAKPDAKQQPAPETTEGQPEEEGPGQPAAESPPAAEAEPAEAQPDTTEEAPAPSN